MDEAEGAMRRIVSGQHRKIGVTGSTLRMDDLFHPDFEIGIHIGFAEDGSGAGLCVPCGVSENQSQIFFLNLVGFDHPVELTGSVMRFCNEYHAAGIAVEARDDRHLTPIGNFESEDMAKMVPECHGAAGARRVDQ